MPLSDWREPSLVNGDSFQGGRLYIDMGILSTQTPNVPGLFDLVPMIKHWNDYHSILSLIADATGFLKNNIDHFYRRDASFVMKTSRSAGSTILSGRHSDAYAFFRYSADLRRCRQSRCLR